MKSLYDELGIEPPTNPSPNHPPMTTKQAQQAHKDSAPAIKMTWQEELAIRRQNEADYREQDRKAAKQQAVEEAKAKPTRKKAPAKPQRFIPPKAGQGTLNFLPLSEVLQHPSKHTTAPLPSKDNQPIVNHQQAIGHPHKRQKLLPQHNSPPPLLQTAPPKQQAVPAPATVIDLTTHPESSPPQSSGSSLESVTTLIQRGRKG